MQIDGGEMLVRVLKQHGIDTVFTLHGGHLDAIFQAALDHGLRLIDTRHEQAAGHAADGWARTTGKPGVAIITAGPGVTDVVTGVAMIPHRGPVSDWEAARCFFGAVADGRGQPDTRPRDARRRQDQRRRRVRPKLDQAREEGQGLAGRHDDGGRRERPDCRQPDLEERP